jgi:hypothetical protein
MLLRGENSSHFLERKMALDSEDENRKDGMISVPFFR